jgi:hypothetical protein
MFRFVIVAGAALLAILYAPAPDPRILDARQMAANAASSRLPDSPEEEYSCPMDRDVRSPEAGFCTRCGMRLIKGFRDVTPYPLNLDVQIPNERDRALRRITFEVRNPLTGSPVRDFEIVHEKLYHLFVVSQDLTFFLHTHPERDRDEDFHVDIRFPMAGTYRILSDFYPRGGGPQLVKSTVIISGPSATQTVTSLKADLRPKKTENAHVEVQILPAQAASGQNTTVAFRIAPAEGLQPYLGAAAHLLAASTDLVDMVHSHPSQTIDEPGGEYKDLFFHNMVFPRSGIYRVWIQFQRLGIVNTASFDILIS